MKKVLIYYSRTGRTEVLSRAIGEKIGADIIAIKEKRDRRGIFSFMRAGYDARREKGTEIEPRTMELQGYETVIIATPVWSSCPSPAIREFVIRNSFKDRKIILVATCYIAGWRNCLNRLSELIREGSVIGKYGLRTLFVSKEGVRKKGEETGEKIKALLLSIHPDR